jgi:hypothetical protein
MNIGIMQRYFSFVPLGLLIDSNLLNPLGLRPGLFSNLPDGRNIRSGYWVLNCLFSKKYSITAL